MWSSLLYVLVCNLPEFWTKAIIKFEKRDTLRTLKMHITLLRRVNPKTNISAMLIVYNSRSS